MAITYSKLRQLKVDLEFHWQDIIKNTNISSSVTTNIGKDKYVNLESLEKIIVYLNNTYGKDLGFDDVVEIRKDGRSWQTSFPMIL